MNNNSEKILPNKLSKYEYSKQVTAKFCSLVKEGKIMLPELIGAIEYLSSIMNPVTINNYRTDKLNHYNSVKDALKNKRLMNFKIGNVIFIPEQ